MPGGGSTLADMLATVPKLLSETAPRWGGSCTQQALRLVCKELSVTTMRTVVRCSVQLGEGACPTPHQVASMMQPARLRYLTVTLITTSGRPGPVLAQQLATCTSQVAELAQSMGTAIQSVIHLTIRFQHNQIRSSRNSIKPGSTSNPPGPHHTSGGPASFSVVARTVCTMLARALPSLRSLTLQGCCSDPAFASFGASCPRLDDLTAEALSVPVKALAGITTQLPNLSSFMLTSPPLCSDGSQLMEYVEASLLALQPSTLLNTVQLKFDKDLTLICKPGCWLQLPPNLHHFECDCKLHDVHNAPALLSSLQCLNLVQTPRFESVIKILKLAPHLRYLYIFTPPGCVLWCNREDTMPGILLLRKRLLEGLIFYFPSLHLAGSNADVVSVLAALPELDNVTCSCVLQFVGNPQPNCLAGVVRVFPRLHELTLLTDCPLLEIPVVGAELLEALAACTCLERLWIRVQMSHTTSELSRLCLGMPALSVLRFVNSAGVSLPELRSAFAAHGRDLDVQEILM